MERLVDRVALDSELTGDLGDLPALPEAHPRHVAHARGQRGENAGEPGTVLELSRIDGTPTDALLKVVSIDRQDNDKITLAGPLSAQQQSQITAAGPALSTEEAEQLAAAAEQKVAQHEIEVMELRARLETTVDRELLELRENQWKARLGELETAGNAEPVGGLVDEREPQRLEAVLVRHRASSV